MLAVRLPRENVEAPYNQFERSMPAAHVTGQTRQAFFPAQLEKPPIMASVFEIELTMVSPENKSSENRGSGAGIALGMIQFDISRTTVPNRLRDQHSSRNFQLAGRQARRGGKYRKRPSL